MTDFDSMKDFKIGQLKENERKILFEALNWFGTEIHHVSTNEKTILDLKKSYVIETLKKCHHIANHDGQLIMDSLIAKLVSANTIEMTNFIKDGLEFHIGEEESKIESISLTGKSELLVYGTDDRKFKVTIKEI